MIELFSEKQWAGEFFLPNFYENRFLGEIHYSPEEGVVLSYTISNVEIPAETEVLHGVLSTGDKCTLIGKFSPTNYGLIFHNGLTTRYGKTRFPFLAIGDHLAHDERFGDIDFSLTNLQEFFFPSGRKDFIKFSEEPIYSVTTSFGEMYVNNTATFGSLIDIASQIYSRDSTALDELSEAFKGIGAKYPQSCFMLKKDIAYRIFLKFVPTLSIHDAYAHIANFSSLFALLIYCPVYPENIHFRRPGADDRPITVYPSMMLDSRTTKLSARDLSHWNMPITQSAVPLDSIIAIWLQAPHSHSPIVSSIQNETGFRNKHTVHGEIVLYATQFESISYDAGKNKKEKYEYPLKKYGCPRLLDGITKAFGRSSLEEAATALGDLRNEIAHIGKPKYWLLNLSLRQLVQISHYLQLTVIGYILIDIGVPAKAVASYQERYSPDV